MNTTSEREHDGQTSAGTCNDDARRRGPARSRKRLARLSKTMREKARRTQRSSRVPGACQRLRVTCRANGSQRAWDLNSDG